MSIWVTILFGLLLSKLLTDVIVGVIRILEYAERKEKTNGKH